MHLRLLAVGSRQPHWVDDAFDSYVTRFPREWRFQLLTIDTARRARNESRQRAAAAESRQLLAKLARGEQLILLDQQGRQMTSERLAERVSGWQTDGRDLAFVIGGPDGVAESLRNRAEFVWSLSELTLPHGLARVLFAEQMYRAWSLLAGHPYHRD